jgi:hypothetical protein
MGIHGDTAGRDPRRAESAGLACIHVVLIWYAKWRQLLTCVRVALAGGDGLGDCTFDELTRTFDGCCAARAMAAARRRGRPGALRIPCPSVRTWAPGTVGVYCLRRRASTFGGRRRGPRGGVRDFTPREARYGRATLRTRGVFRLSERSGVRLPSGRCATETMRAWVCH